MYTTNLAVALAALAFAPQAMAESPSPCKEMASQHTKATEAAGEIEPAGDALFKVNFDAETAYQCVTSVPVNKEHALKAVEIHKKFLNRYSTLAYLKNPPSSYQQSPIDIMQRLDDIAKKVKDGAYKNLYEFDLDLQSITIGVRDSHFSLSGSLMGKIMWMLPDSLVSVSKDGKELPQVFAVSDVKANVANASPIVELNGKSVFDYLEEYVEKNVATMVLDPHADWNAVMYSEPTAFGAFGASDAISMHYDNFRMTKVYNGASLKGKFANGTEFEWPYVAGTGSEMDGINSGETVYEKWVAKAKEEEEKDSSSGGDSGETDVKEGVLSRREGGSTFSLPSFPDDPVVTQANYSNAGIVAGYILKESSVGVLSIPSFDGGKVSKTFSDAVAEFIKKAREAKTKKIVIDVSGNGGGNVMLGYDTFRQFFPTLNPDALFRQRAVKEYDIVGRIMNGVIENKDGLFNETEVEATGKSALAISQTRNKEGERWTSWEELYGPIEIHGDKFTNPAMYNFSNPDIVNNLEFPIGGFGDEKYDYTETFPAEDITVLYDGACGSTCTVFAWLMKNIAGVKSVAVGGIPQYGPMQGVCGTRGSEVMTYESLNQQSSVTKMTVMGWEEERKTKFLEAIQVTEKDLNDSPSLDDAPWSGMEGGQVNTNDALAPDELEVPYQFLYEASNCRLFYTHEMIRDMTKLWEKVAKVSGGDDSLCVPGSVDGPGSKAGDNLKDSPGFTHKDVWSNANTTKGAGGSNGGGLTSGASASMVKMTGLLAVAVSAAAFFL